jgi:hypothetical protein
MTWRRALVWVLAAGAAILSFDALRAYALGAPPLAGGVIPTRTIVDREWLAALWAIEVDLAAAVGILGIRERRKDPLAWLTFVAAGFASVGFQVFTLPAVAARAVPPMALFLAIVVLELPRARPDWPLPPLPPDPEPEREPEPEPEQVRPRVRTNGASFTADQRQLIAQRVAEGAAAKAIQRELGVSDRAYRDHLLPLVRSLKGELVR